MLVTIVPSLTVSGWSNPDQKEARYCEVQPLKIALFTEYQTDALFGNYFIRQGRETAKESPRLTKSIVRYLQGNGIHVLCRFWILDWDTPEHVKWHDKLFLQFYERLNQGYENREPFWGNWYAIYSTPKGCRFIYLLARDLVVEESEDLHKSFLIEASKHLNIYEDNVDHKSDWSRCFYLPKIVKNGIPIHNSTCGDSYGHFIYLNDRILPIEPFDFKAPSDILPAKAAKPPTPPVSLSIDLSPAPEDFVAKNHIYEISGTGRAVASQWLKDAKRRLMGRECFPCLFQGQPIALPGERDSTITKYVGQVVSLLLSLPGTSPEKIYALFLPAVEGLQPDAQTPDWKAATWRKILRFLEQELNKEQKHKEDKLDIFQTIVANMRAWCDNPMLHSEDLATVATFVQRHLIVALGRDQFYIMKQNGKYSNISVSNQLLIPHIKQSGMSGFMSVEKVNRSGEVSYRSPQEVLNDYGVVVSRIEGVVGKSEEESAWISNLGQDSSTFHLPMFHLRSDLEPTYDEDVDEWLAAMEADISSPAIRHWLSHAPDLSRPIAALSLRGPPGVGKKLLSYGLAECFSNQTVCDSREFGRFADGLLKTPVVLINEGLRTVGEGMSPADFFRMLISGDLGPVEFKFKGTRILKCPYRVLITANNLHILEILAGKEEFSMDDRKAIGMRVLHVEASARAAELLKKKGGYNYTSLPGNRWIAGDDGTKSDYKIAKHIMWLYQNRDMSTVGDRFLVQGDPNAAYLQTASLQIGLSPVIVEILIKAIARPDLQKGIELDKDTGIISCTPYAVLEFYRTRLRHHLNIPLNHHKVKQILQRLCFRKTGGKQGTFFIYYKLLKEQADNYGYLMDTMADKTDITDIRL